MYMYNKICLGLQSFVCSSIFGVQYRDKVMFNHAIPFWCPVYRAKLCSIILPNLICYRKHLYGFLIKVRIEFITRFYQNDTPFNLISLQTVLAGVVCTRVGRRRDVKEARLCHPSSSVFPRSRRYRRCQGVGQRTRRYDWSVNHSNKL